MANGNESACHWLELFMEYMHQIDDVIDNSQWSPDAILPILVMASAVYSHPFYVEHHRELQGPILLATSEYDDANHWEKSPELWKRQWADVMRHAGNMTLFSVALLCGGYAHLRKLSAPWLASCFIYHRDKYPRYPEEPMP